MSSDISHWNIKVYDQSGTERETIRNLNGISKDTILQIFKREDIQAQALPFDSSGSFISGKSESVNFQ